MNFNLVEMYNGLLRFNKHILNELAEGLKHLPNLDGVSKGDSLIINEQGNPAWGSANSDFEAGSGCFYSSWNSLASLANVGFFTTVKLD